MKDTSLPTRKTGRTEMDDLVSRLFPELDEPKSPGIMSSSGLHLTLVHPEDDTEAMSPAKDLDEDQLLIDSITSERLEDESPSVLVAPEVQIQAQLGLCDGHSSGVDISIQPGIVEEIAEDAPIADAEFQIEVTANESVPATLQFADTWQLPLNDSNNGARNGSAPKRIGDGKLVPARLTWKPGDPFGEPTRQNKKTFRWELMLTTACVTAACGMVCIWLLRTVLA